MSGLLSRFGVLIACALLALTAVVLVLLRPLMPVDETRYLTVAWEMWQGGSKFVPHLNGELYSHKPPLLFWLINLVWSVTGINDLAARLVAPAFGVAAVALTAVAARRFWPDAPERAGFAALILASTGLFAFYGSTTMFDTMMTVAVLLAMLALWSLRQTGSMAATAALGAALALGVYAKGPVVLVHVMPAALLMPLWAAREGRIALTLWYGRVAMAVGVALALVGLWLGPALVLGGPEYRADVLWRQSAGRMVTAFAHGRPWWFFIALMPLFLWPWGWSMAAMRALAPGRLFADEAGRLAGVWGLAALVAFSLISGKQAHYLVPELPVLALLLSGMVAVPTVAAWRRMGVLLPPALLLIFLGAVALGLVPADKLDGFQVPLWVMLPVIALFALLVLMLLRLGAQVWVTALLAPLTLLMLHVAVKPLLFEAYDPTRIGAILAPEQAKGIAITDASYHGQFTYAGGLTTVLALPGDVSALAAWVAAHPGGIVLSQQDQPALPLELIRNVRFHGKDYRIYRVRPAQ